MSLNVDPADLVARRPAPNAAGLDDPSATYYLENGVLVFRGSPVRHADLDTFVFYSSDFAKDARACYCVGRRLARADPATFRPLNYTYATDGERVWCLAGEIKGVNAHRFRVCDDGRYDLGRSIVPHGYGCDDKAVFFYNYDGKGHVVRGADPETFESLGDGIFGIDRENVFIDGRRHVRVQRDTWKALGNYYNTDGRAILFGDRVINAADLASFRVLVSRSGEFAWARDSQRRYSHGHELKEYQLDLWDKDAFDAG
jgi:hypothetical protein